MIITNAKIKSIVEQSEQKKHKLTQYFDTYVKEIEVLIGKGYAKETVRNWKLTQEYLKEFIKKIITGMF